MRLSIQPPEGILETEVTLPLSKSMSARALLINALTPAAPSLSREQLARCADVDVLIDALASGDSEINAGESGTAMRLLLAYQATRQDRSVTLTGRPGLLRRPIGPLVDALRSLGADIQYLGDEGFPPVAITGRTLKGGHVDLDPSASSQFVTALMLVAPTFHQGLRIDFADTPSSLPYIQMTAGMMQRAGIHVELDRDGVSIAPGQYSPVAPEIEADWSAAAFWYEIAAVTAGWVTLKGLKENSLQGDKIIAEIGPKVGVISEFTDQGVDLSATPDLYSHLTLDMSQTPDMVPALAVTSALASIPFRFTGVAALRIKESNRIEALRLELAKIGIVMTEEGDNTILWDGTRTPIFEMPVIDSHADHRIAMAFAPVAVFVPGLVIEGAECVDKSYPEFWAHLEQAGFEITHLDS